MPRYDDEPSVSSGSIRKYITLGFLGITLFAGAICSSQLFEYVDAHEIMVIQGVGGGLTFYTDNGGYKAQWFGKVTKYPRRDYYEFDQAPIGFNDNGKAALTGSIQFEYPLDEKSLRAIHLRFGSPEAVKSQILKTVTDKAILMTGPLMSSKESSAEKRNLLISYIDDQITNGIFKTRTTTVNVVDELTKENKTVSAVEIIHGEDGQPERAQKAVLPEFGLTPFNFAIAKIEYEEAVEKQISRQQEITMDVQTAIANTKKAEQDYLTVQAQGRAEAERAKWKQEVANAEQQAAAEQVKKVAELKAAQLKSVALTEAQQKLEVATLNAKAAEQNKQAAILQGQGDAEARRLVMAADGALDKKLLAWTTVNNAYATAMKEGSLVPQIVMGGSATANAGGVMDMVNLMSAKTAREIGLDLDKANAQ